MKLLDFRNKTIAVDTDNPLTRNAIQYVYSYLEQKDSIGAYEVDNEVFNELVVMLHEKPTDSAIFSFIRVVNEDGNSYIDIQTKR